MGWPSIFSRHVSLTLVKESTNAPSAINSSFSAFRRPRRPWLQSNHRSSNNTSNRTFHSFRSCLESPRTHESSTSEPKFLSNGKTATDSEGGSADQTIEQTSSTPYQPSPHDQIDLGSVDARPIQDKQDGENQTTGLRQEPLIKAQGYEQWMKFPRPKRRKSDSGLQKYKEREERRKRRAEAANAPLSALTPSPSASSTPTSSALAKASRPPSQGLKRPTNLPEDHKTERTRENWQIQKAALRTKFQDAAWSPQRRLSPDALHGIRALHAQYPDHFTTPVLAEHFKMSPEAIRRILKSKWQPSAKEEEDRRHRWEKRGKRIWTELAKEGMHAPLKWREMGVGEEEGSKQPSKQLYRGEHSRKAVTKSAEPIDS